jgi:hypothetical protein
MKQHITPDQLNELSEKGKRRLIQWYNLKKIDDLKNKTGDAPKTPLLSIGQMIEFLEETTKYQLHILRRTVDWKIIHGKQQYGKVLGGELCDALWEAVKEVLDDQMEEIRPRLS